VIIHKMVEGPYHYSEVPDEDFPMEAEYHAVVLIEDDGEVAYEDCYFYTLDEALSLKNFLESPEGFKGVNVNSEGIYDE